MMIAENNVEARGDSEVWKELKQLREMVEELKETKMDKTDEKGEKYPEIDHIMRMQENAKRLLKMSLDNATRENAPHSSLVKEELVNMMQDDEEVDTKDVK